ncbi:hypothetical protein MKX03_005907 [Papaver bracteatum]|nr:hypothetical protein MKX03_005907 [Papaver bracteatum]
MEMFLNYCRSEMLLNMMGLDLLDTGDSKMEIDLQEQRSHEAGMAAVCGLLYRLMVQPVLTNVVRCYDLDCAAIKLGPMVSELELQFEDGISKELLRCNAGKKWLDNLVYKA